MDLKSLLNDEQYKGATTIEGQLLILAGAGSGKTRVLTYRMAHMIEDLGIAPYTILAITFTNKAAKEMRDRVKAIVGDKADDMWISTFHSTCVRILRREIKHLGYNSNFTIYDSSDQKTLINECMKTLNINDKDINQREIASKIGRAKDKMQGSASYKREFESNFRENKIAEVYQLYQKRLKENNAMDFDDLIGKTVELFKNNPEVLDFYQRKFKYIMVDEYQDTNGAQYELVKLLAAKHKNICVVGDDDQCLTEGTIINSEKGDIAIEDVLEGDRVNVAIGNGEATLKKVMGVSKKDYNGEIVQVKTKSGRVINGTSNHMTFARVKEKENLFYVYLIYKEDVGYSIAQTTPFHSKEDGSLACIDGKNADKVWILKVCENRGEADYYQEYFSAKIDTLDNVEKLMEQQNLYKEYPHYINSASALTLSFFGGNAKKDGVYTNRISFNPSDYDTKNKYIQAGYKALDDFNVETDIEQYEACEELSKKLISELEAFELVKSAKLTNDYSLLFMPLGSVRRGMDLAIINDNEIILDEVDNISIVNYNGTLYDLNIEGTRNYIANGIVMHNCIYAWRGADVTNILNFEKDYPNATVIKLEQNYRSKDNILQAANVVIANNSNRKSKALRTNQEAGSKIKIYRAFDDRAEADFVSKTIADIKHSEGRKNEDFAILYRTNAQSRIFEETLRRRGIGYKIVGGTRFYDRKEIKDMLSYLKVLINPQDDISLKRIVNVPKRSIGDATIAKVQEYADSFELNLWDGLTQARNISTLTARNASSIEKFTELIENLMVLKETLPPSVLIESILKDTGYLSELEKSNEIEDKSRIDNLKELVSDAVEFERGSEDKTLEAYLEKVSLVQDTDKLDEEEDSEGSVVLMTIHSAKGLEFPVVFMVGMENGLFPSISDIDKPDQMEESRRLCYVAITRAKESLYMTSAEMRRVFGRMVSYSQSDFIGEIKSELKEYINERSSFSKSSSIIADRNNASSNPHSLRAAIQAKKAAQSVGMNNSTSVANVLSSDEATIGRKIRHEKFGVGTIVSIKEEANDKKLTIAFDKQGIKTLLLSFAKLELL